MGSLKSVDGLTPETYSVPQQTKRLFDDGILKNPLISKSIPPEAQNFGAKVKYVGSNAPSIPINWRFAESISSLKGLEATVLNVLLVRKYRVEPQEVVINTFVLVFSFTTPSVRTPLVALSLLPPADCNSVTMHNYLLCLHCCGKLTPTTRKSQRSAAE